MLQVHIYTALMPAIVLLSAGTLTYAPETDLKEMAPLSSSRQSCWNLHQNLLY